MKLDFMILADEIRQGDAGKFDIRGAGVTHILASEFPYTLDSLAILVRLFVTEGDAAEPHSLAIRVLAPDDNELMELEGTIDPARGRLVQGHAGEDSVLIVIAAFQGLVFRAPVRCTSKS
jgi:Family of unknown function (DUF6941)